jgi:hypothetical protein
MWEITWAVLGWGWPARLLEDGTGSVDGSAAHLRGVEAARGRGELDMLRALQVSTGQKDWGRTLTRFSYFDGSLKGLSHEIDFKNFDKKLHNLA